MFEDRDGNPRGYVYQGIKKAMDRAGLNDSDVVSEKGGKVTIHTLRHLSNLRDMQFRSPGPPMMDFCPSVEVYKIVSPGSKLRNFLIIRLGRITLNIKVSLSESELEELDDFLMSEYALIAVCLLTPLTAFSLPSC